MSELNILEHLSLKMDLIKVRAFEFVRSDSKFATDSLIKNSHISVFAIVQSIHPKERILASFNIQEQIMKSYEIAYCALRFLEHPLYFQINRLLKKHVKEGTKLLDVGGRASPQTIGLKCKVVITEIPQETTVQKKLNLGATEELVKKILRRRSNIEGFLNDDMTDSKIEDDSFDVITAIEVLEHVAKDHKFIENVVKKLKPNGIFIMSTPNGDCIPNKNPDHVRHYKKDDLEIMLDSFFSCTNVFCAVERDFFYKEGYKLSNRIKGTLGTLIGGIFYFTSRLYLNIKVSNNKLSGTSYLIAHCKK